MSEEEIKEKIKKVIDNPGVTIEKGVKKGWETVKDFKKNKKVKEVIDNPGDALEKGVKKGLETVMYIGKEAKDTVTKKLKEKEKEEKENYDAKNLSTRMVSQKSMK